MLVSAIDVSDSDRPQSASAVSLAAVRLVFPPIVALDDVSLDVGSGEILFLLGPSGSGKSSLLRVLAGFERPNAGRVILDAREVAGPDVFIEPEHRRVGMVFQDYALFPHLTVEQNVAFGLRGNRRAARPYVTDLLERLDVARYAASYPHMLSGGERQRVALARALAPKPRVLLMDEPFSGLDGRLRDRVRRDTLALLRTLGTTTIVVTHDPDEAMRAGDRVGVMRAGRLLQCDTSERLYTAPATPFVARFLGEVNEVAASCQAGRVATPFGTFAAPFADGTAVRVCIRPHHLRIACAATDLRGRVIGTEFLGAATRILAAVDGLATPVTVNASGSLRFSPGDPICLEPDYPHVVIVPDEERSAHSSSSEGTP